MEKKEVTAEIVAIGTELLLGEIVDTNSRDLAEAFARYGIIHRWRVTVGDHRGRMVEAIRSAYQRSDLTFTIGGLGPTADDLTREAVAEVLGEELILDEEALQELRERIERKRPWIESLAKQCYRPASGRLLRNPVGTAPALMCEKDGKVIFSLPGPRAEFRYVLQTYVEPFLAGLGQGVILSRTLRIVGIPEAAVEAEVKDLVTGENPSVAPLVKPGEVHLRVTARARTAEEAQALLSPIVSVIKGRLGRAVYGEDEGDLAQAVLELLKYKKSTLATAESCTGGLLGERLTAIPGASEVYKGGFITYTNELKAGLLAVAKVDLHRFGAVSEPVARQMAEGARRATGADYAVSITGIAGPSGGTPEKPVGLVFYGVSGPRGTEVRQEVFPGDRENIRTLAVQSALALLREHLMAG